MSDADNVVVTDTVDGRLVVTDASGGGFDCGTASQALSCTRDHLAAGADATITVTYDVAADTPAATVGNSANVASDEDTAGPSSDSVDITTHADVADLKVDSPDPVIAGNTLTYTITISNNGPSDAQDVILDDTLDPALLVPIYTLDTGSGPPPRPPGRARCRSAR